MRQAFRESDLERKMSSVDLIPIQPEGELPVGVLSKDDDFPIAEMARSVLDMTLQMYEQAGFVAPWGGYFATKDSRLVGTCGFKGSPKEGFVEIAYFTFPDFEGQGIATAMGRGLVDIAQASDPKIVVTAQTLVAPDASHRILGKLGFTAGEIIQHPDDGPVVEWRRES